jgi:hypothetical protein
MIRPRRRRPCRGDSLHQLKQPLRLIAMVRSHSARKSRGWVSAPTRGVVDQHVDPAPARDHGSGKSWTAAWSLTSPARHGGDASAASASRVFKFCAVEIRKCHAKAALRHFGRGCEPMPARPGDDRPAGPVHDGQTLLFRAGFHGPPRCGFWTSLQLVLRVGDFCKDIS